MTREDKGLLLKDLCARLPYKVKCCIYNFGQDTVRIKEDVLWSIQGDNVLTLKSFVEKGEAYNNISVSTIGRMTKVVSDDKVNCIFEPAPVWDVIIIRGNNDATEPYNNEAKALLQECQEVGQSYLIIPNNFYIHISYL